MDNEVCKTEEEANIENTEPVQLKESKGESLFINVVDSIDAKNILV
jgi:hypothetical protein